MSGQAAALAALNDRWPFANLTAASSLRDPTLSARRPPSPLDFYLSWMSLVCRFFHILQPLAILAIISNELEDLNQLCSDLKQEPFEVPRKIVRKVIRDRGGRGGGTRLNVKPPYGNRIASFGSASTERIFSATFSTNFGPQKGSSLS
jgi:hypothetical protein